MSFRTKLMSVLLTFTLIMTLIVAVFDQSRIIFDVVENNHKQIELIEKSLKNSIKNVDKAYGLLDKEIELEMKEQTIFLINKYNENPNLDTWNFEELKSQIGFDIYFINKDFSVVNNNNKNKLNAKHISSDFIKENSKENSFYTAELNLNPKTDKVKKQTYVYTPDNKYLLLLELDKKNPELFTRFNLDNVTKELKKEYAIIEDINIYDKVGEMTKPLYKQSELSSIFKNVFDKNVIQEQKRFVDGEEFLYHYIPYEHIDDSETYHNKRVIEIIYNESHLESALQKNAEIFSLQLIIILLIAFTISYFGSKFIARPMYLAFYDPLTGLANRAYFEQFLSEKVARYKKGETTALMVIDLDDFRNINETLGHDKGDYLLRDVGRRIKSCLRNNEDIAARLSGDEFTIILPNIKDTKYAEEVASRILKELKRPLEITEKNNKSQLNKGAEIANKLTISASIGIAIVPNNAHDSETLYKKADTALYYAKRNGKNTYKIYDEELE